MFQFQTKILFYIYITGMRTAELLTGGNANSNGMFEFFYMLFL